MLNKKFIIPILFVAFLVGSLVMSRAYLTRPQNIISQAFEESYLSSQAKNQPPAQKPGEVIVKFKQGTQLITPENIASRSEVAEVGKVENYQKEVLDSVFGASVKELKISSIRPVFPEFQKSLQSKKFSVDQETPAHALGQVYKLGFPPELSTQDVLNAIRELPTIEFAEPNYEFTTMEAPNDPYYQDSYPGSVSNRSSTWNPNYDYQWGLKKIAIEEAWNNVGSAGTTTVVAVIDTGVDYTHPELGNCTPDQVAQNQCAKVKQGYDFVNNDQDAIDDHGHGTHVAGIIAANTNESAPRGMAGIDSKARILPLKVLSNTGRGYVDIISESIIYAADNNARVINMSLGNPNAFNPVPEVYQLALDYAFSKNVVVVAAAGNSGSAVTDGFWPANYPGVIAVGASTEQDLKASFSNYGTKVIMAPGGASDCNNSYGTSSCSNIISLKAQLYDSTDPRILTAASGEQYLRFSGTSMAAPHVAGLASMILSKDSSLSYQEVTAILQYTSDDLASPGIDTETGYGRINAQRAISLPNPPPSVSIASPNAGTYVGRSFSLTGTVTGRNFSNYTVEIGIGQNPTEWKTDGINLTNGGTQPVENNTLANIDLSSYSDGPHVIRLKAASGEVLNQIQVPVILDKQLRVGWPQPIDLRLSAGADYLRYIAVDMNNDKKAEVFAQGKQSLYLWNDAGVAFANFPKNVASPNFTSEYIPVAGDIDNDGSNEVVTAYNTEQRIGFNLVSFTNLVAVKSDGQFVQGFPIRKQGQNVFGQPLVTDITGDQKPEIIVIEKSQYYDTVRIYTFDMNGDGVADEIKSQQISKGYEYISTGDIDNDGTVDIVLTGSNKVLSAKMPSWTYSEHSLAFPGMDYLYTFSAATLADLDDDGTLEILVTAHHPHNSSNSDQGAIFIYKENGQVFPGWPKSNSRIGDRTDDYAGAIGRGAPLVIDMNKDGTKEIIVGTAAGKILIYNRDGSRNDIWWGDSVASNFNKTLISTDINGDTFPDFIVGSVTGYEHTFFAWDHTGTLISGWPKTYPILSSAQLADLDGDGKLELIAMGRSAFGSESTNEIVVWNMNNVQQTKETYPLKGWNVGRTSSLNKLVPMTVQLESTPKSSKNYTISITNQQTNTQQRYVLEDATAVDADNYKNTVSFSLGSEKMYKLKIHTNLTDYMWLLNDIVCNESVTVVSKDLSKSEVVFKTQTEETSPSCTIKTHRYNYIWAHVFNDMNKNGKRNSNEPFMAEWAVRTFDEAGNLVGAAQSSSQSGVLSVGKAGNYTVCLDRKDGWNYTSPSTVNPRYNTYCHDVSFSGMGESKRIRFGVYPANLQKIILSKETEFSPSEEAGNKIND